jgi:hypothetical protein
MKNVGAHRISGLILSKNNVLFINSEFVWELGGKMIKFQRAAHFAAIATIWVLILIGVLISIAVPFIASGLVDEYGTFAKDFWIITALLYVPIIFAESLLVVILALLRRIRIEQMFASSTQNWVRALSLTACALSASFVAILFWLNLKKTLPPVVGIALITGVFLPLAVALVTTSLLGLLKQATSVSQELEGVV